MEHFQPLNNANLLICTSLLKKYQASFSLQMIIYFGGKVTWASSRRWLYQHNILYMLKSPIIFSFLCPNAHVKLYFPVDHPWLEGIRTFNDLCKQWRKLNTAKKASTGQVFQIYTPLQMYFWHVSTSIVCCILTLRCKNKTFFL